MIKFINYNTRLRLKGRTL